MSNSAVKKARRRSNLFENDYEDLIYSSDPIKIKNLEIEKEKKPKKKPSRSFEDKKPTNVFGDPISKIPVKCSCNKCGTDTDGTLLAVMYCAFSGLNTPFVSYDCPKCNHHGKRSVTTKALPTDQFEKLYF